MPQKRAKAKPTAKSKPKAARLAVQAKPPCFKRPSAAGPVYSDALVLHQDFLLRSVFEFVPCQHCIAARATGHKLQFLVDEQATTIVGFRGLLRDTLAMNAGIVYFNPRPDEYSLHPQSMASISHVHFGWHPEEDVVPFACVSGEGLDLQSQLGGDLAAGIVEETSKLATVEDVDAFFAKCMFVDAEEPISFLSAPGAAALWFTCLWAMRRMILQHHSFTIAKMFIPISVSERHAWEHHMKLLLWERKPSLQGPNFGDSSIWAPSCPFTADGDDVVELSDLRNVLLELQEIDRAFTVFSPAPCEDSHLGHLAAQIFDWDGFEDVVPLGPYSTAALKSLRRLDGHRKLSTMQVNDISTVDDVENIFIEQVELSRMCFDGAEETAESLNMLRFKLYWTMRTLLRSFSFTLVYVEHDRYRGRQNTQIKACLWQRKKCGDLSVTGGRGEEEEEDVDQEEDDEEEEEEGGAMEDAWLPATSDPYETSSLNCSRCASIDEWAPGLKCRRCRRLA